MSRKPMRRLTRSATSGRFVPVLKFPPVKYIDAEIVLVMDFTKVDLVRTRNGGLTTKPRLARPHSRARYGT